MTRKFSHWIYELNASQIQDMWHIPIVVHHFDPTSLNYSSIMSEKVTSGYNKTSRVFSLKNVTMPWQFYIAWNPPRSQVKKENIVEHHKRCGPRSTLWQYVGLGHVSMCRPFRWSKINFVDIGKVVVGICGLLVGWALVVECVSVL